MNTQNSKAERRYLIINHLENNRPYRIVGSANRKENENFYSLFLRILPGTPFYIVPHRERSGEYLIFSGKKKTSEGNWTFFCKVGSGLQLFNKNIIEVHLPDLRQVYYLKLDQAQDSTHKMAAA